MNEELLYTDLFKIVSRIRLDDASDREAEVKNLQNLIQAHTQSKLKAFAEEFEKAIGEDEHTTLISKADLIAQENGSNVVQLKQKATTARNRYRAELMEALKAIKEKAGIE